MPRLNLSACPICDSRDSLSRQASSVEGHEIVWYECRQCSSFLLWAGNDQWIYQRVGRKEKAHLLKQPLTTAALEDRAQPAAAAKAEESAEEDGPAWGVRINTDRRSKAKNYPQWAHPVDQQKWGERGLIVWDRGAQTITRLSATQAVGLLDALRNGDVWKERGIVVGEPTMVFTLDKRDPKREYQLVNTIALVPSQVQELLDFLARHEAELRQISAVEEDEKNEAIWRAHNILIRAAQRAEARESETPDGEV
jgi:hypothetical protein